MRTTLDINDELLQQAIAKFPRGTPKTVILEEALRRLIGIPDHVGAGRPGLDPRLERLMAEGKLTPRTRSTPPPVTPGVLPLDAIMSDLARDRDER